MPIFTELVLATKHHLINNMQKEYNIFLLIANRIERWYEFIVERYTIGCAMSKKTTSVDNEEHLSHLYGFLYNHRQSPEQKRKGL